MTYGLYRLTRPGDDVTDGTLLGWYADFDEALAARDDDTVDLFAATGPGEVLSAHHQIIGSGGIGPATEHPVSSQIQRSTATGDHDVTDVRDWLREIHRPD